MLELCKVWKCNLYFLIFIILCIGSYGITECRGTTETDDIPCQILLPVNTTSTTCSGVTVEFYNESKNIYNYTLTEYNDHNCNVTFNDTSLGVYTFHFSNGDSGSIIVTEGYRMVYLFYFILALLTLLAVVGIFKQDVTFTSIAGMGAVVVGIYIHRNGFSTVSNTMTEFLAICFICIGFYFMVPLFQWAVDELNRKPLQGG